MWKVKRVCGSCNVGVGRGKEMGRSWGVPPPFVSRILEGYLSHNQYLVG